MRSLAERFNRRAGRRDASSCWPWAGYIDRDGYGRLGRDGLAHRLAYELYVGAIPVGLTIDHLCRNRWCVNPSHLEPVTRRVNTLRGAGPTAVNARKAACTNGHELDGDNTYWVHGRRQCRACNRAAVARYRATRTSLDRVTA